MENRAQIGKEITPERVYHYFNNSERAIITRHFYASSHAVEHQATRLLIGHLMSADELERFVAHPLIKNKEGVRAFWHLITKPFGACDGKILPCGGRMDDFLDLAVGVKRNPNEPDKKLLVL